VSDYEVYDEDESAPDKRALFDTIDSWLAHVRPERYKPKNKEWMEAVVAKVARDLRDGRNLQFLSEHYARHLVHQREGVATIAGNRFLRQIGQTGKLPLGWGEGDAWKEMLFDTLHLPLATPKGRVCINACSSIDLDLWAKENLRAEAKRMLAQKEGRGGAALLSEWMGMQKVWRIEDIR
jgi:hypothetical protein